MGMHRPPIWSKDGDGRNLVTFDAYHSHEDILRYVVGDIGLSDARALLNAIEKGETVDGD